MEDAWTLKDCVITDRSHAYLLCDVCTSLMREPKVLNCGHTFCAPCTKRIAEGPNSGRKCPTCRNPIVSSSLPTNMLMKVLMSKLAARCKNQECGWTGCVEQSEAHSVHCPHSTITCPFKDEGCLFIGMRGEMADHANVCSFRVEECKECREKVSNKKMEDHKKSFCKGRTVFCPFYREDNERHLTKMCDAVVHMRRCVERVEECDVEGCSYFGTKKAMEEHKRTAMEHHNVLLWQAHQTLASKLVKMATGATAEDLEQKVLETWCTSWVLEKHKDKLLEAERKGLPLTSDEFQRGEQRWRFLFFPRSSKLYLQLRMSPAPVQVKIILSCEDRTEEINGGEIKELKEGDMAGMTVTGDSLRKTNVVVKADVKLVVYVCK